MQDGRHQYPISDLYVGKARITDVNYFNRSIKFENDPFWKFVEIDSNEVLYEAAECIGSIVFYQIDTFYNHVLTIIKAP